MDRKLLDDIKDRDAQTGPVQGWGSAYDHSRIKHSGYHFDNYQLAMGDRHELLTFAEALMQPQTLTPTPVTQPVRHYELLGYWEADAHLTFKQSEEDRPILHAFRVPDGAALRSCELWVNGRVYRWQNIDVTSFGYEPPKETERA